MMVIRSLECSVRSRLKRDLKDTQRVRNGLACDVSGTGPDVACVHGWGVSATIWDGFATRARSQMRVHAVDLPGHGKSPAGAAGLNNWTSEMLAVVAPASAVFMGWSLGGLLCLQAACRYPERVRGLILVGSLPRMLRSADWAWGMKASAVNETARGLRNDYITTLQEFLMLQVLGEPGARHLVRQMRAQLLSAPPARQGLERGLDILHEADFRKLLPAIDVPVLIINGERDRMCHPEGARWMAEQLPDAQAWIVPRAAHAPFLSHEREFTARVARFVQALD